MGENRLNKLQQEKCWEGRKKQNIQITTAGYNTGNGNHAVWGNFALQILIIQHNTATISATRNNYKNHYKSRSQSASVRMRSMKRAEGLLSTAAYSSSIPQRWQGDKSSCLSLRLTVKWFGFTQQPHSHCQAQPSFIRRHQTGCCFFFFSVIVFFFWREPKTISEGQRRKATVCGGIGVNTLHLTQLGVFFPHTRTHTHPTSHTYLAPHTHPHRDDVWFLRFSSKDQSADSVKEIESVFLNCDLFSCFKCACKKDGCAKLELLSLNWIELDSRYYKSLHIYIKSEGAKQTV